MKRKFTFLLMALLALTGFKSWGQTDVEIGTGTYSNSNAPFHGFYNYSYSQMLYLGSEIGTSGTINSISFNVSNNSSTTVNLNIYMKCVDRDSYSSKSDWEPVTNGDLVCSTGTVSFGQGWVTFTLDTPFQYDGSKNLMIAVDNNIGNYSSSYATFKYTSTSPKYTCIYQYSDGTNVDPMNPSAGNSYTADRPNIIINITESGSCPKPKDLAVSNITATGATISWTGSAESYDLAYGVASTFNLENPSTYTLQSGLTTTSVQLSGLTAETEYKCAVKAHCSAEEESNWSDVVSFMPTAIITLTVYDGSAGNQYVPFYGEYADSQCKSQFIMPSADLENMHDGIINSMTFYLNANTTKSYTGTWTVYVKEVEETTLDGFVDWNNLTGVYTGNMTITEGKLTINFGTPFEYGDGNLLIGFNETTNGNYSGTTWLGVNQSGKTAYYSYSGYYGSGSGSLYFLPKTTFKFLPGAEKFAITLTQPEDAAVGTISADYEQAPAGTTVTLSANFNLGYTLNHFVVDTVSIVGNTFEMPEHDVTVSVAYNTLDMYDITFDSEIDDDIISVSATYNGEPVTAAPAGTEITLSYSNLDEGYTFNYWTLNGAQLTGSTFEMPEEDAVIGVNLTERERYAVTIDSDVQDYITADPSSDILDGTTVTLTISPATGYVLAELHVLDEGENEQDVTITENSNIRTFIMPESNVTVSAVFSPVYNISIDMALVGGSISQMSAQGTLTAYPAGTQVFLFANPDEDYSFVENSFIVIRSDGEIGPTVTYTNMMYSFIMPESNVTVSATFNKTAFAVSQVVTPTYSGSFSISKTAHVGIGETVTLSNFNAYEGYYFDFEDVNSLVVKRNDNQETVEVNNYGNIYQFAMPTSDVTVTATFKDLPRYSVFVGDVVNGAIYLDNPYQDILAGAIVYFEVEPETGYTLESITVTPEEGNPFEPTQQSWYYYFTMPSSNVTISATFRELQSYTINYYVNGELEKTLQCREDYPVNIDNPANIPAGVSFEGWGVASINTYLTEKPAIVDNYELPTQNYDLYAVLSYTEEIPAAKGGETWKKVTSTSELSAGDEIVLVYSNLVMCTRENAYWEDYPVADVTISNDEITYLPENAAQFTLIANNGYWNLQYNELGATRILATNSYNNELAPKDLYESWYPTYMSIDFTATTNGNSVLFYNSDTYMYIRYRSDWSQITTSNGSSTTYACQAYKLDNPVITNTYYMTSVLADGEVTENTTAKNIVITTGTVTVDNNIVLTMNENGLFRNENAAKFVFEDGAQLIYDGDETVNATMKKNINCNASKASNVNWYTISSPLAAENTAFANVTNLIPSSGVTGTDYDLYRLDEANGMWINARPVEGQTSDFTTIDKGRGYIYSKTTAADIAFTGEVNVADVECNLTIGAANGFNLIGNPFMQNITLDNVDGTAKLADGFYVLNGDNTWGTKLTDKEIKPLQGFLVQATTAGDVTISKPTSSSKGERSNEQNTSIEVIVSNSNYSDNAYAMFGEGTGLNKVSHRNAQAPMIYIPQGNEDFAIAFMNENTTVFPVSFKAMTTGKYSISLKATDDISTLVLVDNMTGTETNMLLEDSYSFIGSPADSDGRFTVKLSISHSNGQADNEHFVYQNGSELVVNGEGTLQIFDVLGRVVISEEVHGQTVNVGNLSTGAYIVRLTGESVMTQKIVVR